MRNEEGAETKPGARNATVNTTGEMVGGNHWSKKSPPRVVSLPVFSPVWFHASHLSPKPFELTIQGGVALGGVRRGVQNGGSNF